MYHIIVNSRKLNKKDKKIDVVKSVFDRAGKDYAFYMTEYKGHAKEIAEQLTLNGDNVEIIAMGGDGTLHEILNGVRYIDKCTLGVIPIGTANDFAFSAGIPEDVKVAAEIIAFKAPSSIDFIQLENGLRSINAVGSGIDVDVLQRVERSGRYSKGKYFRAFISSLLHYKSRPFTVFYNGKEERHNGLIMCIGNGRRIGGGIQLFPSAKLDDGYLDLVIVDYISRFKTISAFIKLMRGKLDGVEEIKQIKCKEAAFISMDKDYIIQAEGEMYENLPLKAKIVSEKLKFYIRKND